MSDFSENPAPKPVRGTEETDFPVPAQPPPLDKGSSRRERLITLVAAAIVAALVSVVVIFGLRAFQGSVTYGPEILERNQVLKQQGTVTISGDATAVVYYPVPYDSPPNLTFFGDKKGSVIIVEQKADYFKVNTDLPKIEVQWQAQGLRAAGK
jgi:hypothetical protein